MWDGMRVRKMMRVFNFVWNISLILQIHTRGSQKVANEKVSSCFSPIQNSFSIFIIIWPLDNRPCFQTYSFIMIKVFNICLKAGFWVALRWSSHLWLSGTYLINSTGTAHISSCHIVVSLRLFTFLFSATSGSGYLKQKSYLLQLTAHK